MQTSLAAISAARSTRESLAKIGGPEVEATLGRAGIRQTGARREAWPMRTAPARTQSAPQPAKASGSGCCGPTPGAAWVRSSSPSTPSSIARWRSSRFSTSTPTTRQPPAVPDRGRDHRRPRTSWHRPGLRPGSYADGRPFYAMRFIRGDSLKEAIESLSQAEAPGRSRPRSLELRKLLRRFIDVCNAIEYAHSRGVLHRDIKPGNVIVGKHGETLVVDWGLAKAIGRADPNRGTERTLMPSSASGSVETLPGSALGTPAYMSPEQAAGELERLGPRSDVYSLGAHPLLPAHGQGPASMATSSTSFARSSEANSPRPAQLDRSIDPALEAVCLKAMATVPDDRYPSCRALAQDVDRWAADEPVTAYDEPFLRRARRWANRRRTMVTAAIVALLAGVVGLSSVAAVQSRSNAALTKANDETQKALVQSEAARKKAETAETQSKAVADYLVDIFKKPDPNVDGRLVKLADVLDKAAAKLRDDPNMAPVVRRGSRPRSVTLTSPWA